MSMLADLNPLAILNIPFWAQLTSGPGAGGYYAWREQLPQPGGTFVNLDGGRVGTANLNPAYDPNGKTLSVVSPTNYFLLRRAYYDPVLDWVYLVESGGGVGSGSGGTVAFSGAKYIGPVTTTVPSATATSLTQTGMSSTYDTDSYGTSLAAPVAGYYAGLFEAQFPTLLGNPNDIRLTVLTSTLQQLGDIAYILNTGAWNPSNLQVYWEGHLVAGESVGVQAYQNSGFNQSVSLSNQTIHAIH